MVLKPDQLTKDRLISLVLQVTEEILEQSDRVVDHYRSVFFSGANPEDITDQLGNLGSELVKLADIAISLSGLNDSLAAYEAMVDKIVFLGSARKTTQPVLKMVPWPDEPTIHGGGLQNIVDELEEQFPGC